MSRPRCLDVSVKLTGAQSCEDFRICYRYTLICSIMEGSNSLIARSVTACPMTLLFARCTSLSMAIKMFTILFRDVDKYVVDIWCSQRWTMPYSGFWLGCSKDSPCKAVTVLNTSLSGAILTTGPYFS